MNCPAMKNPSTKSLKIIDYILELAMASIFPSTQKTLISCVRIRLVLRSAILYTDLPKLVRKPMMLFLYGDRLDCLLPCCSDFVFLWFVGWC